jgi:hypothetical protein
LVPTQTGGTKTNPAFAVLNQAATKILILRKTLGLSGPSQYDEGDDELDEFMEE